LAGSFKHSRVSILILCPHLLECPVCRVVCCCFAPRLLSCTLLSSGLGTLSSRQVWHSLRGTTASGDLSGGPQMQ
jgi:hypothetical protein